MTFFERIKNPTWFTLSYGHDYCVVAEDASLRQPMKFNSMKEAKTYAKEHLFEGVTILITKHQDVARGCT